MALYSRILKLLRKGSLLLKNKFEGSSFYIRHFLRSRLDKKAALVRKKDVIKVAFELHDIAKWKTEPLFVAMSEHPRFEPVIVACPNISYSYSSSADCYLRLIKSLEEKRYSFIEAQREKTIVDLLGPDIVFFQEPYEVISPENYYYWNRSVLFCYVGYAFHNLLLPELVNPKVLNMVWQCYFENRSSAEDASACMTNQGDNIVCTGLPVQDLWLSGRGFDNPWRIGETRKKRIIWAPHHTIPISGNLFEQSTFLAIADDMLTLAEKYKDTVQWAFKPHPFLKAKLTAIWGLAKTEEYYSKWDNADFAQLEDGEYYGLFMHSDALIHDCMSFTIEYQYTLKPAFYIENGKNNFSNCNRYSNIAHDIHYKGTSIQDIEDFVVSVVINGEDNKSEERTSFFNEFLIPPGGKSACHNIIDAILRDSL